MCMLLADSPFLSILQFHHTPNISNLQRLFSRFNFEIIVPQYGVILSRYMKSLTMKVALLGITVTYIEYIHDREE